MPKLSTHSATRYALYMVRCAALGAAVLATPLLVQADNSRNNPTSDWLPPDLDWSKARAFRVLVEDQQPAAVSITLQREQPYRLIFDNRSLETTHDLTDLDLFHAVVLDHMTISGANVVTPHIHSLRVQPRSKVELFLVPKFAGRFSVGCHIDSHQHANPVSLIVIE